MHFFGKNIGILVIYLNQSNTNTVTHVFVAFIKLNVSLEIQYVSFSHPEAEFKEFKSGLNLSRGLNMVGSLKIVSSV